MKIKSWPFPPLSKKDSCKELTKDSCNSCKDSYEVPQIPDEFRIFGINYLYKDNKIVPKDISNSDFNKENILQLVRKSYSKYLKILTNCQPEDVEEINKIHLELNEELNKCKEVEVEFELKRLKNEKNKKINEMVKGLEEEMI